MQVFALAKTVDTKKNGMYTTWLCYYLTIHIWPLLAGTVCNNQWASLKIRLHFEAPLITLRHLHIACTVHTRPVSDWTFSKCYGDSPGRQEVVVADRM
eukprot:scaffold299073_cov45-Prasinocladus_malaysianus.AAC.1